MDHHPTDPTDVEQQPDTGDLIDPDAEDAPPPPVTDPDDPSYVEPAAAAVPVNPANLLPPPGAGLGEHLLNDQRLPAGQATDVPTAPARLDTTGISPLDDPERDPGGHA